MRSIQEQLLTAFEASGLSVNQLKAKAGLDIDRTNVGKKLKGELRMNVDEAQAFATALGVTIVWPPRQRKAKRRRKPAAVVALGAESVA